MYGSEAPILYNGSTPVGPVSIHIRVCWIAAAMKFAELQQYAIKQLYTISSTNEDPISFLAEVCEPAPVMSVDLQGWARRFRVKFEGAVVHEDGETGGVSNYEKVTSLYGSRFYKQLWDK